MTVEFFDLARRLYAAKTRKPVMQVAASLFTMGMNTIFVDAEKPESGPASATIWRHGAAPTTVTGGVPVLRALAAAGAVMDPHGFTPQLVVQDGASLAVLENVARAAARHDDDAVRGASAVVGWWVDRSGYPGTNAVVDLLAHSRQRYITGAIPSREQEAKYWRGVFALGDGPAGTEAWASRIAKGDPLELAAIIRENDAYAYRAAAERFAQGWSWTGKEPAPIAAMGLRARCESADLWEAALRTDRLWRHRAVHTGHVTGGTVTSATRSTFTVACPRMGSRLRAGSDIVGWIGGVDSADRAVIFHGEIQSAEAHAGELHLTVARVQAANRPSIGHWVTLMPAPPNDRIVRMSRSRYRRLLFQGDSWIAAGKPPGVRRRDVPLDVLVAAAETD